MWITQSHCLICGLFTVVMKNISWFILVILLSSFTAKSLLEKGNASYYSSKMDGRRTASGEVYRNDSLTAAHKSLPLGTLVRVHNLKNDSIVIVRINDRMGKSSPHVIDLSVGAAKKLNFLRQGITPVTIEKIELISMPTDTLTNTTN